MKNSSTYSVVVVSLIMLLVLPKILFAQEESDSINATIQLSFLSEDTVKQVSAKVINRNSKEEVAPLKDVEVHFYVQRIYGLLPLGDAQTTNENGEAIMDFPKDLPGDSAGDVVVIARVEDDDALGNLEVTKSVKWGIPVINKSINQRALWASGANAPIPLVIAVTSMIIVVWGVIIYIIVQLFKIKKIGIT